ncbi:MAG TPA: DUF6483 family protein [Candidatus Latescibacteria bacterium]|nr:DUF6483 family protein [Candidatus Latescibacterota bacterium]
MIRQDYLMRLLDQLAQALARVLSLRENEARGQALDFLNRESERLIGIDGAMLEILSPDAIQKATASVEKSFVAARILEEISLISEEEGDRHRATAAAVKAFWLYAAAAQSDASAADNTFRERIAGFGDACAERGLDAADLRSLMAGYEMLGEFGRAEDALFALVEVAGNADDALPVGRGFYARLAEHEDAELEKGGLPRNELQDGVDAFLARVQSCMSRKEIPDETGEADGAANSA